MGLPRLRQAVVHLHQTRDRDGDGIFYFYAPQRCHDGEYMQSSPIVSIRRCLSAVLDRRGRGNRGKSILMTLHSDYEVQMPHDTAEHLAVELETTRAGGGP
jgi:hypothetical protein